MPHADTAYVPQGLGKPEFWEHVHDQLASLLDGQRSWVRLFHPVFYIQRDSD